jgi:predicted transcriptional regulator
MSTQITITLPDDVYQRAKHLAQLANRDVASVLADTIQSSMPSVRADAVELESVSDLADEQVVALTELQMGKCHEFFATPTKKKTNACTAKLPPQAKTKWRKIRDTYQMEPNQDVRLSELLDRQQAGTLLESDRPELQSLMQIYQKAMLRKTAALVEAVKRGLIEPLS